MSGSCIKVSENEGKNRNSLSVASRLNKQSHFNKVVLLGMTAHTAGRRTNSFGYTIRC